MFKRGTGRATTPKEYSDYMSTLQRLDVSTVRRSVISLSPEKTAVLSPLCGRWSGGLELSAHLDSLSPLQHESSKPKRDDRTIPKLVHLSVLSTPRSFCSRTCRHCNCKSSCDLGKVLFLQECQEVRRMGRVLKIERRHQSTDL
ncbi:hypothetical protein EYF80_046424 [Liparis tanakae]|uniref:Uncharacterized protein n=1 Tax=Liparis tanakae TaxID=230148 RepID=A0A4Z2FQ66_9TELE|nr:hypothetical protein EYF80_046424 [Liparis tanakae]